MLTPTAKEDQMVRTSFLGCVVMLATALAIADVAVAAPIAQPGAAFEAGDLRPAVEPVAYNRRKSSICRIQERPHYYALNPGRYDSWGKYGPYTHKHFGGHRWHDLNYNGCAPWWQPAPYGSVAAGRAFKNAYNNPHIRWCFNRYRSYDPRSDTYVGYDGNRHTCRGPSSR